MRYFAANRCTGCGQQGVKKMFAPLEFIFIAPYHHRVHHATNLKYPDRIHAGILIIWDRMFGTFQPEEERPVYKLTKNVNTFNPVKIAFHKWVNLSGDFRRGRSFTNAIKYLLNPPGWSHDGKTKTTKALRKDIIKSTWIKNILP